METQTAQPRSQKSLIAELHKLAGKTSTEFWAWWWMLSKEERREVLNQVEAA